MFATLAFALLLLANTAAGAQDWRRVSCGEHDADTCSECPAGNGLRGCKGECSWCYETGNCYPKGTNCKDQAEKEKKGKEAEMEEQKAKVDNLVAEDQAEKERKGKEAEMEELKAKVDNLVAEVTRLGKLIVAQVALMKSGIVCEIRVDGQWGSWGSWSSCSKTCGPGHWTRKRRCDDPSPENGGAQCDGSDTATVGCYRSECPVLRISGCSRNHNYIGIGIPVYSAAFDVKYGIATLSNCCAMCSSANWHAFAYKSDMKYCACYRNPQRFKAYASYVYYKYI